MRLNQGFLVGIIALVCAGGMPVLHLSAAGFQSKTLFLKEYPEKQGNIFSRFFKETIEVNAKLFSSPESLVVFGAAIPLFLASRDFDDEVSGCFYDRKKQRNCNQLPDFVCDLAGKGVVLPIIAFSSLSVFSRDVDLRITSSIFWKGVVSIWIVKNIFKNTLECDFCCRPPDARFCQTKKYYGGFPSGHVSEAVYMALVYGNQHGLELGLPLWMYAAFVAGVSLDCNRHYVSQVVGGAALGILYGIAANKLIDDKRLDYHLFIEPMRGGGVKAGVVHEF